MSFGRLGVVIDGKNREKTKAREREREREKTKAKKRGKEEISKKEHCTYQS